MNRKDTTRFLGELLIRERLLGKYWASEVSIDYGTEDVRRVDFLQFCPENTFLSGIEKGIFICYEVKSCKADFKSGWGQNFIGEKNYLVMPMDAYKQVMQEIPGHVGVLIPVPAGRGDYDEFEAPTPLIAEAEWRLRAIRPAFPVTRRKSMVELLFCMLRSGRPAGVNEWGFRQSDE